MTSELPPIPPPSVGNSYPDCGDVPDPSGVGCCFDVVCADFDDSQDACPPPNTVFGNGCSCGAENKGPYAPSKTYPPASPNQVGKPCCYLVASGGCLGRPLIADNQMLIAGLVRSSDWLGTW
jgi:hypothetical protein